MTFYARDDLQSSFSFRRADPGGRAESGEIRLSEAQIIYDVPAALRWARVPFRQCSRWRAAVFVTGFSRGSTRLSG